MQQLYKLIKSLDRSEKRSFKLYVNRLESNKDVGFIKLFDVLERMKQYDESYLLKYFPNAKTNQFANVKRHLYSQIMKSLRLVHANKDMEIQVREYLDFARILYGKGLYLQSLKLIDRVKPIAKEAHKSLLYFETLEFQKLIESRHITRSRKIENKVEDIIYQTDKLKDIIASTSNFLNLSLRIQGLYIKIGFAKNEKDLYLFKDYFYSNLPPYDVKKLSFYEKVLLHQSFVWFHHTTLNFKYGFKHALQWVAHFNERPQMKRKDPDLYFRGLHYVLTNSFYLRAKDRFDYYFNEMVQFYSEVEPQLLDNTKILYFNYRSNAELNKKYLEGEYTKGIEEITEILSNLEKYKEKMDAHRYSIFNYKIGWLYLGSGNYEKAIDHFNIIINQTKDQLRLDLLAYAKLLHLICHLELKHYEFVSSNLTNVKRSFDWYDEKSKASDIILEILRKTAKERKLLSNDELDKAQEELKELRNGTLSSRPFLYFDFISWMEALANRTCIENISIES